MSKAQMIELEVSSRSGLGKGPASKMRRQGEFPAVMYGHGDAATTLAVNQRHFFAATHTQGAGHSVMNLLVDGDKATHTVVIKSVQRHPLRHDILHVDFQEVRMDEKIQATVAIALVGQPAGVKLGGVLQHVTYEITVEALPTDIPDQIEADISALDIGDHLRVSDLPSLEKLHIITSPEEIVASVITPRVVEEAAPAAEEGVAEAEAAEGGEAPAAE